MNESIDIDGRTSGATANCFDAQLAWRAVGLVAADLALLCTGAAAQMDALPLLTAHIALVAACAFILAPARSVDRTPWTLSALLVLIAGPLGGVGILFLGLSARRGAPDSAVLEAWYDWLSGEERFDPVRRLYEAILAGRAYRPASQESRSFSKVIQHGSLAEKQALLGHVGLKYHPDYFPLLALALRSPQSPVRAQAAAVFVRLREQFRQRLYADREEARAALERGDAPLVLTFARSILDCAESGFLDRSEAREALEEAKALCMGVAPSVATSGEQAATLSRIVAATGEDNGLLAGVLAAAAPAEAQMRQLMARSLMATGRHRELHRLLFGSERNSADGSALAAALPSGGGC